MEIQISVIIWTVICFCVLMLILKNLLFKPVLKVMDQRNERLDKAKKKKAEIEEAGRLHQEKLAQQQAEYDENRKKEIAGQLSAIREESKNAVIQARKKRIADVEEYRAVMAAECEKTVKDISVNAKSIAEAFARQIIAR